MIWWLRNNSWLLGSLAAVVLVGWLWHESRIKTFRTEVENETRITIIQAQAEIQSEKLSDRREIESVHLKELRDETEFAVREFKQAIENQPQPVFKIDATEIADECSAFVARLRTLGAAIDSLHSR